MYKACKNAVLMPQANMYINLNSEILLRMHVTFQQADINRIKCTPKKASFTLDLSIVTLI